MVEHYIPEMGQTIKIPELERCPYWSRNPDKPYQENGYCSYLEQGDWEVEGLSLLWDQCKECGIKNQRRFEMEGTICVMCAWRRDCNKKFSRAGGTTLPCADYTRDLSLPKPDEDKEHGEGIQRKEK